MLLYHHIGYPKPGAFPELTISPEQFERQVRRLVRSGYQAICPSDWLAGCRGEATLPEKPVLLTFDDAYADLVNHALPVLRGCGFGAAVYVVTGHVGGTNVFDQTCGGATHDLMTADQIRAWAAQGIEFGAHGRTHADLTNLTEATLEEEVAGSRADLETILGRQVISFAYPRGLHNETVRESVRKSFALAFTVQEGLNDFHTDPHLLRRSMVQPRETLVGFECRLRWGWNPFHRLRSSLARAKKRLGVLQK